MRDPICVGLGDQVVSSDREDILVAYGLGSCLGITMVDPIRHIGGLLHTVLPLKVNGMDANCSKYVDSGIESLLKEMLEKGASRNHLVVRMAGGANMLVSSKLSNTFDIGTRNIEVAHRTFSKLNLTLKAEEVGGSIGRTVRLFICDNRMTVRIIGGREQEM